MSTRTSLRQQQLSELEKKDEITIADIHSRKWTKKSQMIGHIHIMKWVPNQENRTEILHNGELTRKKRGRKRKYNERTRVTRSIRKDFDTPLAPTVDNIQWIKPSRMANFAASVTNFEDNKKNILINDEKSSIADSKTESINDVSMSDCISVETTESLSSSTQVSVEGDPRCNEKYEIISQSSKPIKDIVNTDSLTSSMNDNTKVKTTESIPTVVQANKDDKRGSRIGRAKSYNVDEDDPTPSSSVNMDEDTASSSTEDVVGKDFHLPSQTNIKDTQNLLAATSDRMGIDTASSSAEDFLSSTEASVDEDIVDTASSSAEDVIEKSSLNDINEGMLSTADANIN